jgi:hypothetical protein
VAVYELPLQPNAVIHEELSKFLKVATAFFKIQLIE